jgi:fructose-1,6-bisphosphatase/inositol monophosphatase family enzyme
VGVVAETADAELAGTLVQAAGRLAARMLSDGLTAEHKTSVTDIVTAADHAAEALIVERLRAARPDDGLVGEEGAREQSRAGPRTWHVDPVDGTYNFLSGLPFWCSALALAVDDDSGTSSDADSGTGSDPVLGAVYQPVTDELWLGGRDLPTTCNGEPVPQLAERPLNELSLATYVHPPRLADGTASEPLLRAIGHAATLRMLGSGSVELAAVASGRLGAWLHLDSPSWDWLPGAALVRAAGGHTEVLDAHGHRWHLAGNVRAVEELAELVRE